MKVIFSGGGTLGPVTPLLAVYETIKEKYPEAEFAWIGTKNGPEKDLIKEYGIKFIPLTSGKWRRYFSVLNIFDIFKIFFGFWQSVFYIISEKPNILVSAGGFVSVPLHFAGALLGVKTWVHQQDYQVGLANRLMSKTATVVTVALEKNLSEFNKKKTIWLGNPVRLGLFNSNKEEAKNFFNIKSDLPVVLAMGGGTGSLRVNQLIVESVEQLRGICEIIHLSGRERPQELVTKMSKIYDHYHHFQFLTEEMAGAYALADVVVSRGGFGSIAEIAALQKPAIFIPKPGHQYDNVRFIAEADAALFVDERVADGLFLSKTIKQLLQDDLRRKQLANRLVKLMPVADKDKILSIVETF